MIMRPYNIHTAQYNLVYLVYIKITVFLYRPIFHPGALLLDLISFTQEFS